MPILQLTRRVDRVIAAILFFAIIAVDQMTKWHVVTTMMPGESLPVLRDVSHWTYVQNHGAAFGILEDHQGFFILAGLALIVLFLRYYPKLKQTTVWMHYGTLAMLAGAVGNLIDRVRLHYVVDFFDFRIWPVFNIADIAIVGGVISMIYAILFKMKDDEA